MDDTIPSTDKGIVKEAAEAEIEKLKGEVSRLRGERYRRQLDQVASPGRINT